MSRVIDNYLAVKSGVEAACSAWGRNSSEVKLLVVSKTIPMDMEIHPFSGRNGNSLPRKARLMHGPLTGRIEDAMMAKNGKG